MAVDFAHMEGHPEASVEGSFQSAVGWGGLGQETQSVVRHVVRPPCPAGPERLLHPCTGWPRWASSEPCPTLLWGGCSCHEVFHEGLVC